MYATAYIYIDRDEIRGGRFLRNSITCTTTAYASNRLNQKRVQNIHGDYI